MKLARRQFLQLAMGAGALPTASRTTWAQAYPTRPITLIVGAAAGGPTDTIGRIITLICFPSGEVLPSFNARAGIDFESLLLDTNGRFGRPP